MLRPRDRLRRRLRWLATVAFTGCNNRSSVAALAVNRRALTSGLRSKWPCRSMDCTKRGSAAFRRLPQMRSDASYTTITASLTASS